MKSTALDVLYFYIPLFLRTLILFRFISEVMRPSFLLTTYPIPYSFGFILMHSILLWVIFTTINCPFVLLPETTSQDSVYFLIFRSFPILFVFLYV
jgi:hypothetical protein